MSTARQRTHSSDTIKRYASVAADTDLTTAAPGYTPDGSSAAYGSSERPCRAFHVEVAGNLVVQPANQACGNVTLAVAAHTIYPMQLRGLVASGSTATGIVIYY